ncbi:MAG: glycosyltransferase family 2 protein [Nitrospirota bacterium]|nr:glycosyltransferase family 2 protein [Nitrospirota bacterium]
MNKTLSIIIPVFNSEKTIGRTLESLKSLSAKSRQSAEVIIIDDGSTDRSVEIVMSWEGELPLLQVVLVRQKNMGTSVARNTGLMRARGEWIFFLDADDELAFDPVPFIEQHADASCLAFSVRFCKNMRRRGMLRPVLLGHRNFVDVFTARNAFQPSNLIFRREFLDSLFDPSFLYLEDWLFWIQNPRVFEKMKIFPDVTSAIVHSHGANKTADRKRHGRFRRLVAEKVLSDFDMRLSSKQKNNLLIQSRIGMVQEGLKVPAGTFFLFPCSLLLYMKLLAYVLFGKSLARLDFYGS